MLLPRPWLLPRLFLPRRFLFEVSVPLLGLVLAEESTPIESPVPPSRLVPIEECPPVEGGVIEESALISAELSTPPKGVVPPAMT